MDQVTAAVILKPGREKPVLNRHPWIFSGAIARLQGRPAPGDLVDVLDKNGRFLARAYYNPHSQIRARILTWDPDTAVGFAFWQSRIRRAAAARDLLHLEPSTTAYRLINAEADGLPGLIVDKYDDYLVVQCLTLGIDRRQGLLLDLLQTQFQPVGIIERSDIDVRRLEGLAPETGVRRGQAPSAELVVQENQLQFGVDLLAGHKTGLYLDQRGNRALLGQPHLIAEKELLNVFSYTGGFAIYAAVNGSGPITNLDSSTDVLAQAERNMALNRAGEEERPFDEYVAGDAFEVLRHYRDTGREFDVIVLDPPKFAHSRRDVKRAARGYKDLNWLALRLLRPGGLLMTFSCSGRVSAELFQKIVFGAAVDAARDVQMIRPLSQAADHPVLLTFPESAYLKGLLCRVW